MGPWRRHGSSRDQDGAVAAERDRQRVRFLIDETVRLLGWEGHPRLGCDTRTRAEVARLQGFTRLPASYDEFLAQLGHQGPFDGHRPSALLSELFIGDYLDAGWLLSSDGDRPVAEAEEIGAAAGLDLVFPGQRFVFLGHDGYLINYFEGVGDDAQVWQIPGNPTSPMLLAPTFTAFLERHFALVLSNRGVEPPW